MNNHLLTLLQLGDSNFPSGAFSHSFGLETYIQEGAVHDKETFFTWLRIYLEKQLANTDGLAFRMTFDALSRNRVKGIWTLDQKLFVQALPEEARQANRRIGERLIRMGIDLYTIPLLNEYLTKIRNREAFGHPAIVFSIICHHLNIESEEGLLTYLYSTMGTLVQNGVRGIPLGQTAGQKLLLELNSYLTSTLERIISMDPDDFGAAAPGIEISQMRHERLHVRLFIS